MELRKKAISSLLSHNQTLGGRRKSIWPKEVESTYSLSTAKLRAPKNVPDSSQYQILHNTQAKLINREINNELCFQQKMQKAAVKTQHCLQPKKKLKYAVHRDLKESVKGGRMKTFISKKKKFHFRKNLKQVADITRRGYISACNACNILMTLYLCMLT